MLGSERGESSRAREVAQQGMLLLANSSFWSMSRPHLRQSSNTSLPHRPLNADGRRLRCRTRLPTSTR
eukprot:547337-Pleurochrysis_carterae.AAC.2